MVRLTCSLQHWLWENHKDIMGLIMLGHIELMTNDMCKEYIEWCKTEEGKRYLVGGDLYYDSSDSKIDMEEKE